MTGAIVKPGTQLESIGLQVSETQERFLFAMLDADPPTITQTCKDIEISRVTVWKWRLKSTDFQRAFQAFQMLVAEIVVDQLIDKAWSDNNASWILARIVEWWGDPRIYRPQLDIKHHGEIDHKHEIQFTSGTHDDLPV